MKVILFDGTFDGWRKEARVLLEDKISYESVEWILEGKKDQNGSLFEAIAEPPSVKKATIVVPREFMNEAELVACIGDAETYQLLYRLAYRIVYENKNLMSISLDSDVLNFERKKHLVTRDIHKMKAFVRFREVSRDDQNIYMAWYRSDYRILKFAAPFFTDRFQGMNWIIFTADDSMCWSDGELSWGPGITEREAMSFDGTEDLWKTYYSSIFNPARVKISAMKKEMPVRFWKTLPEAQLIDQLLDEAPARLEKFYQEQKSLSPDLMPAPEFLENLSKENFKTVIVGEHPQDQCLNSDLLKHLSRESFYYTTAVKILPKKGVPDFNEIAASRPYLRSELNAVKPELLICLGGNAAQAVFGKLMRLKECEGKILKSIYCERTIVLAHPNSIARTEDAVVRKKLEEQFGRGLKLISQGM